MAAKPFTEECIEAAYRWLEGAGVSRDVASGCRIEWPADIDAHLFEIDPNLRLTDDREEFWPEVPLGPRGAADNVLNRPDVTTWLEFLGVAKEFGKYEGTDDIRERVMRERFWPLYEQTIRADEAERASRAEQTSRMRSLGHAKKRKPWAEALATELVLRLPDGQRKQQWQLLNEDQLGDDDGYFYIEDKNGIEWSVETDSSGTVVANQVHRNAANVAEYIGRDSLSEKQFLDGYLTPARKAAKS